VVEEVAFASLFLLIVVACFRARASRSSDDDDARLFISFFQLEFGEKKKQHTTRLRLSPFHEARREKMSRRANDSSSTDSSPSFVRRGRRFRERDHGVVAPSSSSSVVGVAGDVAKDDDDDDDASDAARKRATTDHLAKKGTRPGPHGNQRLISTGNEDVDDVVLGGGLPLNGALGVFVGGSSSGDDDDGGFASSAGAVAKMLARLFLSEGALACEQDGLWLTTDDDDRDENEKRRRDARETLPRLRKEEEEEEDGTSASTKTTGEKEEEKTSSDGLKIAWQYRRYLEKRKEEKEAKRTSSGGGGGSGSGSDGKKGESSRKKKARAFCHDFDVTRAHSSEEAKRIPVDVVRCDVSQENVRKTFEAVERFGKKLAENDSVGRIVVEPPRALLDDPSDATAFKNYLGLLHAVKGFMHREEMEHRVALFIVFPPKQFLSKTQLTDLRQTCECYVELSSLLNPDYGFDERAMAIESVLPEPTVNCIALLSLGKKHFSGALAGGFGTVDSTFAVQRRGKKYGIKPLAQRPEDHDSNAEKKTNNGSGGLCSGGPSGSEGPLDF
jgi:elongator complex protein 4